MKGFAAMKTSTVAALGTALVLATVAAFLTGRALATGAPTQTPLTYAGTVTDKAGKPYDKAVDVTLAFYDSPTAAPPKCPAPTTQAEAGSGRFAVVLPPACVQAFRDVADVWVEATVGADKVALPRVHVGAVPYALWPTARRWRAPRRVG